MRDDRAPATVVVCCGVPGGARPEQLVAMMKLASRKDVPVSWAARTADMDAVLEAIDRTTAPSEVALFLDTEHLASRPALRRELAAARGVADGVRAAVASGAPNLDHRDLLVDQGIHAIAVGGFDGITRSGRRPPPAGWACRSVVWGLWEARTVPAPTRSTLGRLLPWAVRPRAVPGSLTVVHIDSDTLGPRLGGVRLERLMHWIERQPERVRAARLSELPDLLRAATQRDPGSVLRAAA